MNNFEIFAATAFCVVHFGKYATGDKRVELPWRALIGQACRAMLRNLCKNLLTDKKERKAKVFFLKFSEHKKLNLKFKFLKKYVKFFCLKFFLET